MSRYGLWLLALAVPLVVEGCTRLELTRPVLLYGLVAVSVLSSAYLFRPAWADRQGFSPNWLAQTIWTKWPSLDNPVPEVFAERAAGRPDKPAVPVGTGGCEKVLVRGDGTDAWWPFPCLPQKLPDSCTAERALCYVNAGVVASAPNQARFVFDEAVQRSWTVGKLARLEPVLGALGASPKITQRGSPGCRVVDLAAVEQPYIVQGSTGLAVWVRALEEPTAQPAIRVRVMGRSTVQVIDPETMLPVAEPTTLSAGTHAIAVPPATVRLVLVTDVR